MSLDMNSLPNDVKELKKIIIFQNNKLIDQKQKEVEYQEEIRLQKLKESEHLDQIEHLKIQLFGRKTEKWSQIEKDQGILFNEIESPFKKILRSPKRRVFSHQSKATRERRREENRFLLIFQELQSYMIFPSLRKLVLVVMGLLGSEKKVLKSWTSSLLRSRLKFMFVPSMPARNVKEHRMKLFPL
ncbi:hypothetical protein LEP1GSC188_1054 [Leptospira weilii serovar Topaz str. LT2116]|uniref:IS166 homeodomain transposase C n=1 Tax=Leptospira weilii serovar Topaz str. LT2116 TaxID=1088540 RepID=M3GYJ5_9LEPT|nr:hypothetical protein LEP1GSC188_1054 [Leptospira weilii serovar Topaz str. LT2116]